MLPCAERTVPDYGKTRNTSLFLLTTCPPKYKMPVNGVIREPEKTNIPFYITSSLYSDSLRMKKDERKGINYTIKLRR